MATQLKQEAELEPQEEVVAAEAADNDAGDERDFDTEARSQGWLPKEEFKGDPAKWVEAEAFVKRADEVMPLLKEKVRRLERKMEERDRQFRQFAKHATAAEARVRSEIEAEIRSAVKAGDVAAFDKLSEEAKKLEADSKSATKYTETDLIDAFDEFRDENPWYDRGNLAAASELEINARLFADRMMEKHSRHIKEGEEPPPKEFMERVLEDVIAKYPGLKAKPRREKPASDVAPPSGGRPQRNGRTYDALPPEAKAKFDKWMSGPNPVVDMGSPEKTRAYFVKTFDWDGYAKEAGR